MNAFRKIRRVEVRDCGADAVLVERATGSTLILRDGQTFQSAVRSIAKLVHSAPDDDVRALVRKYLPDAPNFDEWIPAPPTVEWSGWGVAHAGDFPRGSFATFVAAFILLTGGFLSLHEHPEAEWEQEQHERQSHLEHLSRLG